MKTKILELRRKGKTYREISELLNVGMQKVEYYCNPDRKEMLRQAARKYRKGNPLFKKVSSFHGITKHKVPSFTYREFLKHIGETPVCYITKVPINLGCPKSYSVDHIIPNSKGGTNSIDNAGLIRWEINQMKRDKTPDEFFALCKEVLEANGYRVEKTV